MGTDVSEVTEPLPSPYDIKVHRLMCTELIKLVKSASKILPEIEAARPRCSSGIDALCLLNRAIAKARLLVQHCCESSKLYLALTRDAILSRCEKSRKMLEQSLSQMQNMVPVLLAAQISHIVCDLKSTTFSLDPSEEEAGKVLHHMLHQYGSAIDSNKETVYHAIQAAAVRLHITSQKALLIERRSIKKLLGEIGENDPKKRNILVFFENLLIKYGNLIVKDQKENVSLQREEPFSFSSLYVQPVKVESRPLGRPDEAQRTILSTPATPEEFQCPLSLRLMFDPVVIASGQTFERMWIQKWFDEGHDTCPKTQMKLSHLTLTPNTVMKDLIAKWRLANKVTISDPSLPGEFQPLDTSSSSIASLGSSMNDLSLPIYFSNLSMGSSDARQGLDSSYTNIPSGLHMKSTEKDDCNRFESSANSHEINVQILFELDSFPWELRCKVVKDIEYSLKHEQQNCRLKSGGKLVLSVLTFLKDAHDLHDVEAQKIGCLLLSALLKNCRSSIPCLKEEAYGLLASFLDTEVAKEALSVLEVLSYHGQGVDQIAASGALTPILKMLDEEIAGLQDPAFKILCNLSANSSIRSLIVSSAFMPKLVLCLEDTAVSSYCIAILRNLCYSKDARVFVAETDGCLASITKLLDSECHDDQEHAVAILLSLCSQHVQFFEPVMYEGVIPALVTISNNGNDKGKAMATELLRLLREEVNDNGECLESDPANHSTDKKPFWKPTGIFKKMARLSKPSSFTPKMKT